jgi:transposase
MGTVRTDEFRKDAVRIALTSGLSRKQIADDLGVGMSTLNKWITAHRDTDVVSSEDRELALENERLRRENRILREERDILKKATVGSSGQRNGSFEGISRRLEAKRFPGPRIEPKGDLIKVMLSVNG